MAKRIPIRAAKDLAAAYGANQVIVFAWDGKTTHVVTYGRSTEDCDMAARGANAIKERWGWPDDLMAEPSRVRRLKARIAELEARLREHEDGSVTSSQRVCG